MSRRKYSDGDIINGTLLISLLEIKGNHRIYLCKCQFCGNEFGEYLSNLVKENPRGCGCRKGIGYNVKHGATGTTEYKSWQMMKERCLTETNKAYPYYGGRGIKVCDRWLESFENFLQDMGKKPSPLHSLDRFPNNKDGHYEPGNCRWGTDEQQCRNRRSNVVIEYNGEKKTLIEWSESLGFDYESMRLKVHRIGAKKAFDNYMDGVTSIIPSIEFRGKVQTLSKWCEELGLNYESMRHRIRKLGWSPQDAFTKPIVRGRPYPKKIVTNFIPYVFGPRP